jgi:hypothetical protein
MLNDDLDGLPFIAVCGEEDSPLLLDAVDGVESVEVDAGMFGIVPNGFEPGLDSPEPALLVPG